MGVRRKSIAQRLGTECAIARVQSGGKQISIAKRAGVSRSVLSKFENGRVGWPQNIEAIVRAYELECGLQPEDLWRRAICSR